MMDLVERKDTRTERKLPKNIRQIGEPGTGTKVFIEDYAYTYLHQLAEENLTSMKTAVLVGDAKEESRIFIQGALELDMGREIRSWFSNEHWREIFREIHEWYEGMDVVGWFLSNPGFPPVLTEEMKTLHLRNFSGDRYVFFQMDVLDNEEIFYAGSASGPAPLSGYYIYYERNDPMQAYMSQKRGGIGIEPEGMIKDQAAAKFRNVMQEKREQNGQRKMLAFLYTASTFLVMVILVIGITMINNYDRMVNMEDAIYQLSENLEEDTSLEAAAEEENRQALETAQASDGQGGADTEEASAAVSEETPPEETSAETPAPEETATAEETVPEDVRPAEESAETQNPTEEIPAEEPTAQPEPEEEVQEAMSQAVQEPESYMVQAGDTLLEICRDRYGNEDMVAQVCELNQLDDGDKIYEGQVILLP